MHMDVSAAARADVAHYHCWNGVRIEIDLSPLSENHHEQ